MAINFKLHVMRCSRAGFISVPGDAFFGWIQIKIKSAWAEPETADVAPHQHKQKLRLLFDSFVNEDLFSSLIVVAWLSTIKQPSEVLQLQNRLHETFSLIFRHCKQVAFV